MQCFLPSYFKGYRWRGDVGWLVVFSQMPIKFQLSVWYGKKYLGKICLIHKSLNYSIQNSWLYYFKLYIIEMLLIFLFLENWHIPCNEKNHFCKLFKPTIIQKLISIVNKQFCSIYFCINNHFRTMNWSYNCFNSAVSW